jgi:hypothetical protein
LQGIERRLIRWHQLDRDLPELTRVARCKGKQRERRHRTRELVNQARCGSGVV